MLKKFINYFSSNLIEKPITLKYVKTNPKAVAPYKAHTGLYEDAAYDLFSCGEEITLQPKSRIKINTHISFIIPNNYWIKLGERSGLASKGIQVLGGYIDSGYVGSIIVMLYNSSDDIVVIPENKAICQFTIEKLIHSNVEEVSFAAFTSETFKRERGSNGFGSSDK